MIKMMKTMTLIAILAVAGGAAAGPGVDVGDKAPGFTLNDSAGNAVSLADFKGKSWSSSGPTPTAPLSSATIKRAP